ncbi:MAG: beta-hydroxyacyl-ACP dehydratase [Candidatus Marinimicrobia bacterium]|nr:beta-hydroxyacyl-ACP dehydratase [Candidatus Neomarinimicrobiota bacterium]|tara:strand:+ start:2442 stop:2918 length:477 start_codon:yes stop_codon:yes gene_type:complete
MDNKKIVDLDVVQIQKYQQNRHPVLFIDFVNEVIPGESAYGYKCFSFNEWYFPAHFNDEPNVPGFIQIESLTQLFLMTFLTLPGNEGKKTGFVSIKSANFKKKIVPGNRLDISAKLHSYARGLARGNSKGYINNELACEADLVITIPDIMTKYSPVNK